MLTPDTPIREGLREPPRIQVTRAPDLLSGSSQAVVSGSVQDDQGVRDVMIFHGEDKVFFRGGEEGSRELPFSVERPLEPGVNYLYILARDHEGLVATTTVRTWLDAEGTPAGSVARREGED